MTKTNKTFNQLNQEIQDYNYPPNYMFDAETLEPSGVLAERDAIMQENGKEFYHGGKTFLDIGCNKGYWMFKLKDNYDKLIGYEMDGRQVNIAKDIKDLHGIDNIKFNVGTFKDIPKNAKADVVYLGGVHHHIFAEDINRGLKPMDFVYKLKKMADKYLIIDGVMNWWDYAMYCKTGIIKGHNIKKKDYEQYTLENIQKILAPQFKLIQRTWDGIGGGDPDRMDGSHGGRYYCVWQRIKK
jgi:SAM-dependent methyltransferase